jgi:hypothetical protein
MNLCCRPLDEKICPLCEYRLGGYSTFLKIFSYLRAYGIVRSITGVGQGKGPFLSIHDGFQGLESWWAILSIKDLSANADVSHHPQGQFPSWFRQDNS